MENKARALRFFRLKDKIERNIILLQKTVSFQNYIFAVHIMFFLLTLVVPHMSESGLSVFLKFQQKLYNV